MHVTVDVELNERLKMGEEFKNAKYSHIAAV